MPQPTWWALGLDALLEDLGPGPWAVRSSALAEDGNLASFAGQQHTHLDCQTPDDVFWAITDILARLYHVDLQLYHDHVGLVEAPLGLGIVIQPMIRGTTSGVLFTHDPLGIHHQAFVVTATSGGAVGVVEGREGDTFYASRTSGELLRGGADTSLCQELFHLVHVIREAYGEQPWDLEWTTRPGNGELVVLQMRPAKRVPLQEPAVCVWTNTNVGEALPGVGTPMTWSIIERFSHRGFVRAFGAMGLEVPAGATLVGGWQGRVYLNLSEFMGIASSLPWMSPRMLWRVAGGGELTPWMLEHLGGDEGARGHPAARVKTVFRVVRKLPWLAVDWGMGPWQVARWERHVLGRREALEQVDLGGMSDEELARCIKEHDVLFEQNGERMLAIAARFLLGYVVMRTWMSRRLGEEEGERLSLSLMSGMALRSREPVEALLKLAAIARDSAPLQEALGRWKIDPPTRPELWQVDRVFAKAFEALLHRDGSRAQGEAELAVPRWREAPEFLFETIHQWATMASAPPRVLATQARAKAQATLSGELGPLEAALVIKAWEGRRADAGHRETLRALVVETLGMYRTLCLQAGERLCEAGVLTKGDDVFLLTHAEVMGWLQGPKPEPWPLKLSVLLRREKLRAQRALPALPATFLARGSLILPEPPGPIPPDDHPLGVLTGLPGAPGQVVGQVHLVSSKEEMAWGAVLVMPYADIGATPLFMRAGALVVELGGPLSHACIVAREYGIPTVVNVAGAMTTLEHGARVSVDGTLGVVRRF